ncbi:hypothetical protein CRYUN_Cryun36dG0103700 [Craigia yunnanensis]
MGIFLHTFDTFCRLYSLGARKIIVVNVVPIGCIPYERELNPTAGDSCASRPNQLTQLFNTELRSLIKELSTSLKGSYFDSGSFACCYNIADSFGGLIPYGPLSKVCPDRSKYVFWDPYHPSDAANVIIAKCLLDDDSKDISPMNIRQLANSPANLAKIFNVYKIITGLQQVVVKFKQFDYVTDFSDHYYYCRAKSKKRKVHGKMNDKSTINMIMKEWEILEKHLPESIFVRVYEGRIDLLRAAIIGAQKTPYHHGLFFFDISFPSDYPNNPPKVRYQSFGLRLNPNLYSDGYVCLSLLNTWDGEGTEMWNPSKSTILQVLLSLQGLVLNEKPYYNEPGLKPAWSWEAYNADVFTLSCKTMLFLLENPLRNFEGLIAAHFREHASTILRACLAYRECRVCIGFFNGDDANAPSSKKKIKVSKQFKNSMDNLYPDLFKAFDRIGAPLQNMPEKPVNDVNIQEKPVNGIISKLKTFWEAMTT